MWGRLSCRCSRIAGLYAIEANAREASVEERTRPRQEHSRAGSYATRRLGVPTPLFNASAAVYTAAMAQGFDKQDTAAVCAVMEAMANLRRG